MKKKILKNKAEDKAGAQNIRKKSLYLLLQKDKWGL